MTTAETTHSGNGLALLGTFLVLVACLMLAIVAAPTIADVQQQLKPPPAASTENMDWDDGGNQQVAELIASAAAALTAQTLTAEQQEYLTLVQQQWAEAQVQGGSLVFSDINPQGLAREGKIKVPSNPLDSKEYKAVARALGLSLASYIEAYCARDQFFAQAIDRSNGSEYWFCKMADDVIGVIIVLHGAGAKVARAAFVYVKRGYTALDLQKYIARAGLRLEQYIEGIIASKPQGALPEPGPVGYQWRRVT